MKFGGATVAAMAFGGSPVAAAYLGSTQVFSSGGPPVNTVAPVITPPITLHPSDFIDVLSPGTWTTDGAISGYTYQWKRDGVVIVGETTITYTVLEADYATSISCEVTATDEFGSTTVETAALFIDFPQSVVSSAYIDFWEGLPTVGLEAVFEQAGAINYEWWKNAEHELGETGYYHTGSVMPGPGDGYMLITICVNSFSYYEDYSNEIMMAYD